MRTINSSAININNTPSTSSSFDTPASRSATAPAKSSSASVIGRSLDAKRFPTAKSPRTPITPSPQARGRFPSAPVSVAVTSNTRSPQLGHNDHKQQHVLALTTTTTRSTSASSAVGSDSKMPDSRSRTPHLSAAAAKNVGRTPMTPKIAAKGPALAVRRSTPNRDDATVTPRSSGRQSRSESTNTTPNGTPIPEKSHDGWDPRASLPGHSKRLSISRTDSGNDDSKFFYASDARGTQPQQPPPRPPSTSAKPATFFYANGINAEERRTQTPPIKGNHSPATATPPEPAQSKFFYASGAPEPSLKPGYQSSGPSSAGSSNPKWPNNSSSNAGPGHSMPPRPLSPIKMLQQQNPPSILKNAAGPSISNRHHISSPPPISASAGFNTKRKVSLESAPRSSRGHSRASSIPSIDSTYSPRLAMSPPLHPSESSSPPASPTLTQPVMTMASLLQAAEEFAEESEGASPDLQSPTKSTHSADPVNELVANARRERKVQDLQITNASLEAINRTLERQLRKQTAEIRRFRRLSRAGHLSLEPTAPSSQEVSTALPDIPASISELSDEEPSMMTEEEEEDEEDFDSLDDSDLSLEESGSTGEAPEPDNEKTVVRRQRDERRLRLDLTKHHELLVDSQKINQSLKRCLNWTEALIKEGQKALEYKVRVSDVQFGGHILAPPDDEETHLDAQLLESLETESLGDESLETESLEAESLEVKLGAPVEWEKSSQDRDSGIELQTEVV